MLMSPTQYLRIAFLPVLAIVFSLVGCTGNSIINDLLADRDTQPKEEPAAVMARVERVDVMILESFPVQIHVKATGYLPDACYSLGEAQTELNGMTFTVVLPAEVTQDEGCAGREQPFSVGIPLDVLGLRAGVYTVLVNGVSETFELYTDNGPLVDDPLIDPPGPNVDVPEPDFDVQNALIAKVGEEFSIPLESNPTTGYQWQLAYELEEGVLELIGSEYAPPASDLVGAGGVEFWSFRCLAPGKTVIAFKYVRPWEAEEAPVDEQRFMVEIQ